MILVVVAKDHVWVHVRIQLLDSNIIAFDCVLECRGRLRILTRAAATVVAWALLIAVAINVHASQQAIFALYVHNSKVVEVVATVGECCMSLVILLSEAFM